MGELKFDRAIYDEFLFRELPLARRYVWIATANVKNLYIPAGRRYRTVLWLFEKLARENVSIRILAAKDPSGSFDTELDRRSYLRTSGRFEMFICPRNHAKAVIIDGRVAYAGSANFTGAGIGARSEHRRNFEIGFVTGEKAAVDSIAGYFDSIWMGAHCPECGMRDVCPEPVN